MKKLTKILTLVVVLFTLSGCFRDDKLSNDNVYTTIYPIEFLTKYLYGENKTVTSIYPAGADVTTYKLTDKQKETYQKGALFVYNGLTNEKELAKEFLNNNKNILLIDISYGLKYENDISELWLSPNNYLMLAKNIKNNLVDYTTSKTIIETIEKKYKELEEDLSYMDADLRNIANTAIMDGNKTIITSSNKLKFLENYGFEVIALNGENISETLLKSNFKSEKYKNIFLCDTDTKNDLINDLEKNYKANIINVSMMNTLSDVKAAENETYLTIMNDFIEDIRNNALS